MVVNVVENPIKCPVAPLEFLMLADWYFHERGIRDRVELIYATPLPGAFTKPMASKMLREMLDQKGIKVETEFLIERADPDFVQSVTGFAIGGVPPVGHRTPITTFIDEDLMHFEEIWAAAGTPNAVFKLTPAEMAAMTHGQVVSIK